MRPASSVMSIERSGSSRPRAWRGLLRSSLLFCASLLCLAAAVRPVAAQGSREQIRAELELTDRGIERAADYLGDSPCVAGQAFLNRARDAQGRAREQFARGTQVGDRAALALTREARKLVNAALRACGTSQRARDDLQDLIRSTDDLIQDGAARLAATPDAEADQLLSAAREQLSRAREAYAKAQLRPAIRRLAVARSLAQRALQRLRGQSSVAGGRVDAVLDRADLAIAEARLSVEEHPDAAATRLLDQANEYLSRARGHWRDGRPRLAVRAAAIARTLALEAQWQRTPSPDREQIDQSITSLGELLDDLEADAAEDADARSKLLLDARAHWSSARAAFDAGELIRADTEIRSARAIARRAAEEADPR